MRLLALGLALLGSVAAVTVFVPAGEAQDGAPAKAPASLPAEKQPLGNHPHFDDGGAIRWARSLAQAQAAAKKSDKLIFIEFGREA